MTTSTAAHRLAAVYSPVQASGYLGIFLQICQGNQGLSLARQLHKMEEALLMEVTCSAWQWVFMHHDCIARERLVYGEPCQVCWIHYISVISDHGMSVDIQSIHLPWLITRYPTDIVC